MTENEAMRLTYLAVLGAAIAGYYVVAHRGQLGRMLRQALLWSLIFLGAVAGYGLFQDVRHDLGFGQAVVFDGARVEATRRPDGHFYLTLRADGAPVEFVVDTGATDIVLTRQDARRAGIDPDALAYTGFARTANGTVRTARARLGALELGEIVDRNVAVRVNDGEMFGSLLGMAYLRRFDRIEIEGDRLVLHR